MTLIYSHLGHDILGSAEIDYWAETRNATYVYDSYFAKQGHLIKVIDTIEVRDNEDEDAEWHLITADDVLDVHTSRIVNRVGIRGVHPANYAWVTNEDDYDAMTADWVVQHLAFGEVIFG
jgi:hypothetical protein